MSLGMIDEKARELGFDTHDLDAALEPMVGVAG
jgi:hypothetical protein